MTRAASDLAALTEKSAREGRIARARGAVREDNPHQRPPSPIHALHGPPGFDEMRHAWWRGWDQTDCDLRG